jgi:hypothetical protein
VGGTDGGGAAGWDRAVPVVLTVLVWLVGQQFPGRDWPLQTEETNPGKLSPRKDFLGAELMRD